ncbi:MAG: Flp pilus assembly complex ATPase component TadA [Armatimonadetes bacterium]|nr:Flp pilus assembly complex ATPase component TadA [Armatimonadota bacterium]
MKCDTCRELLTAYLKGELEDQQAAEVEEHLTTCAECAKECEGARAVLCTLDAASEEPILRIASVIVEKAVERRASDIHIRMTQAPGGPDKMGDVEGLILAHSEHSQTHTRHCKIFYRIDGVMHEAMRVPDYVHQPLVDRFKLLAGLSLAARDVPQDGRFWTEVGGKKLDLRVSVVPAVTGASAVIRLFDSSTVHLTLDDVYLVGEQRAQLDEMLHRPNGLIIVTGPTGSGKTTTLYAIMQELNRPEVHLMSVEDPVEYILEGVTQIHVNRQAGVDFRTAMRSILRQDPDVIMCGEIRDRETAELCCQAAMTGHLVLTVLHTNDAIKAVSRLLDIGIPRFVISSSLLGATAQRLLRKVCAECREEYVPDETEVAWLREAGVAEVPEKLWRGRGCETCRNTGYKGRLAIYEIFAMDQEVLTSMAVKEAPLEEVEKLAAAKMKSLKQAAAERIVAGQTTVAEAMRTLMFLPEY